MKTWEMAKHFDRKAADWDANERRKAMAADIVRAVEREWPVDSVPRLLDYGAGTGLYSLALGPRCASVLAMDVSSEMLSRVEEKAAASGMSHLKTLRHDHRQGQGNYETLSEVRAPIFFLFTVKCPLVAAQIGEPTGTLIAKRTSVTISPAQALP